MAPPNWSTPQQIRTHQLATSIINHHHNGTNEIFDTESLDLLRQFCVDDPTSARKKILQDKQWPDEPGQDAAAVVKGDLAGYIIVKHGTDDPVFDERDLELLGEWFGRGMPGGQEVVR